MVPFYINNVFISFFLFKHLQTFLDSATDGVVYFSLGSVIKSSNETMSPEMLATFVKIFGELKQKVIWKFGDEIPNLPSNVMVSEWLPQSDIFAHPNVRLFISHGGALGTNEAIYHGLPLLGMPFFGDQRRNIESYAQSGWALRLDYANVTEQSLRWALSTLLDDKKYFICFKFLNFYTALYLYLVFMIVQNESRPSIGTVQ